MNQPQKGRGRGRPSREESQQLEEKIKTVALELFLEHGYDPVSMEAIAHAAGITKRTLYAKFADKGELFSTVLVEFKNEWDLDTDKLLQSTGTSLEDKLLLAAEALLVQALDSRTIKMGRIAGAKAVQFPGEVQKNYDTRLSPRVQSIARILEHHAQEIEPEYLENSEMTAELFLGLITGIPARLAGFGTLRPMSLERKRLRLAVKLFTAGIRK